MKKLLLDLLGDKGLINKVIPSLLKDKEGKLSSKRMIKIAGGGTLITAGLGFLGTGMATHDDYYMIGGGVCIVIGAALAIFLAEKVKDVKVVKSNKENA